MAKTYTYQPDYAVSPGETLRELLDDKRMSHADLAPRTGLAKKTISQIMTGDGPITLDTADKLELTLGVPSRFWNSRELAYRKALACTESVGRFASDVAWLKEVPCNELIARDYVEPCSDKGAMVRRVLRFFGVSTVDACATLSLRRPHSFAVATSPRSIPAK